MRGKRVQLLPKSVGDLEIVALVADHVDEGFVAGVAEIVFRRSHPDGLAALAVQIGPIAPQRRGADDPQRIGARHLPAFGLHRELYVAGVGSDKVFDHPRAVAFLDGDAVGQPAQRARGCKLQGAGRILGRIAPHVLGDDGEPEWLADNRKRGHRSLSI